MKKVIIIICAVIALVVGGLYVQDKQVKMKRIDSQRRAEMASADYLKSIIGLYHAYKGKYPYKLQNIKSGIKEGQATMQEVERTMNKHSKFTPISDKDLDQVIDGELPDLKYYVRESDMQSYKFTYTDVDGNTKTIQEDYTSDLQEQK